MISPTESRLQESECFHFLLSRRTYYNSVPPRSQCPLFRVPTDREERRGEKRLRQVHCFMATLSTDQGTFSRDKSRSDLPLPYIVYL